MVSWFMQGFMKMVHNENYLLSTWHICKSETLPNKQWLSPEYIF